MSMYGIPHSNVIGTSHAIGICSEHVHTPMNMYSWLLRYERCGQPVGGQLL